MNKKYPLNKLYESSDLEKKLQWLREEERHEINWISQRLGWLLLCQSFLITIVIMAQSKEYSWWYGEVVTFLLATLGIWLSIRGMLAIKAAQIIIDKGWLPKTVSLYQKANNKLDEYRINRPIHAIYDLEQDSLHQQSIAFHMQMGKALIFTWIAIIILGIINGFSHRFPETILIEYTERKLIYVSIFSLFILLFCFWLFFKNESKKINNAEKDIKHKMDKQTPIANVSTPTQPPNTAPDAADNDPSG